MVSIDTMIGSLTLENKRSVGQNCSTLLATEVKRYKLANSYLVHIMIVHLLSVSLFLYLQLVICYKCISIFCWSNFITV